MFFFVFWVSTNVWMTLLFSRDSWEKPQAGERLSLEKKREMKAKPQNLGLYHEPRPSLERVRARVLHERSVESERVLRSHRRVYADDDV